MTDSTTLDLLAPPLRPGPAMLVTEKDDPSLMENALPGWDQKLLQLGGEAFEASTVHVAIGKFGLFREARNQAVWNSFRAPRGMASINMALPGSADAVSCHGRLPKADPHLLIFEEETEVLTAGASDVLGIDLPREMVPDHFNAPVSQLNAAASDMCRWAVLLLNSIRKGYATPGLVEMAPHLLTDHLGLAFDIRPRALTRSGQRQRLVGDLVHAVRHQQLRSVSALSSLLDLPASRLRSVFREVMQQDLDRALVTMRLSDARRQLLNMDRSRTTVSTVAMDNGFLHLGRFSQSYKALFGESPQLTLRGDAGSSAGSSARH